MIKNAKRIDFIDKALKQGLRRFLNKNKDKYGEKELKEVYWLINNSAEDFYNRLDHNSLLRDFWDKALDNEEVYKYLLDKPYFRELKGDIVIDENGKIDILETTKLKNLKGKTKKKVRDNMIMDMIWNIMTSHIGSLISSESGNFENIKIAAKQQQVLKMYSYEVLKNEAEKHGKNVISYIKSLDSKQLDDLIGSVSVNPLNPITWIDTFENLMMGNDLIGMTAVNSANHYKYQFLDLKVNYLEGDTFPLKFKAKRQNNGEITEETIYLKQIDAQYSPINGRRIGSIFAQYQAAAPDNGKFPCLGYINASADTIDRIRLLTAFGIDEIDVGFLNTIDGYIYRLKKALKGMQLDATQASVFDGDIDTAINNIYEYYNGIGNHKVEEFAPFVSWYMLIDNIANLMSRGSVLSRTDSTNGALPVSEAEAIQQKLKIIDFKNKVNSPECIVANLDKIVHLNLNATTMIDEQLRQAFFDSSIPRLQAAYTLGINSALNLVKDILPQSRDTVFDVIQQLSLITKKSLLSKKDLSIIKRFQDELTTFILSRGRLFGDEKDGASMIAKRNYYIYNFPVKLKNYLEAKQGNKYLHPKIRKYNIIRLLHINNKGITYERIGKLFQLMRQHYSEELETMLEGSEVDEETKEIAYDLFMYSYYDKGLNFTHNSYGIFFNTPFLEGIEGFIDELRDNTNNIVNNPQLLNRYLYQFMQNNPELIPEVKEGDYTINWENKEQGTVESLVITADSVEITKNSPYYLNEKSVPVLLPFIKVKYKNGYIYFMKEKDSTKTYSRVSVNKPTMISDVTGKKINSQRTPYYNANETVDIDFTELKGRGPVVKIPNTNIPNMNKLDNNTEESNLSAPNTPDQGAENIEAYNDIDQTGDVIGDKGLNDIKEDTESDPYINETSNNEQRIKNEISQQASQLSAKPDSNSYPVNVQQPNYESDSTINTSGLNSINENAEPDLGAQKVCK